MALLEEHGVIPETKLYLKDALSKEELINLSTLLGGDIRTCMRKGEDVYKELDLGNENLGEDQLIDAIIANPILLERPIVVVDGKAAAIGRPPEAVLAIL